MGDALGAVSAVGGMMGGGGGEGGESSTSSASGYAALPPDAQAAYNNYFDLVNSLGQKSITPFNFSQVQKPTSIFDSQELYNLQQQTPNTPINPIGKIEPFNSTQQSALSQWANPDYSQQAMAQYTNPYQQQVTNNVLSAISRQGDIANNNIFDQSSRLNSRANSSSLGTELAQNNSNTSNLIGQAAAQLGQQGYTAGLDLRNNTLQQQMAAGSAIQGMNQNVLNNANPQGQYALLPQYTQAQMLAPLFGAFPQSSVSSGSSTTPAPGGTSSGGTQAAGLGMALFGNGGGGFSSIFS